MEGNKESCKENCASDHTWWVNETVNKSQLENMKHYNNLCFQYDFLLTLYCSANTFGCGGPECREQRNNIVHFTATTQRGS